MDTDEPVSENFIAGFAAAMAEAERLVRGWSVTACGDDYQTDGRSNFWDAGTDYDQSREDAGAAIRFHAAERIEQLRRTR